VSLKLLTALALIVAAPAAAQDRTVKIQVPFAPGGGTDILTRIIAPKLRLNGAVRDVMRMPDVAASLDKTGLAPLAMTAEEFSAYVRRENERWAAVVKAAGIKAE
jgi:tripartite-type tricarboxylate transporter receptor subunit TctC